MGTNFYKIPTEAEMELKLKTLKERINCLELSPSNIKSDFRIINENTWDRISPWDDFIDGNKVHLGKRSSGWKFLWNFHNNKFYSNKEELFAFIHSGRVVDEYGTLVDNDEFIKKALEWGQPNGRIFNEEYVKKNYNGRDWGYRFYDKVVDGLVVCSSTEFS